MSTPLKLSAVNFTPLNLDAPPETVDELRVTEAVAFAKLLAPLLANELRDLGGALLPAGTSRTGSADTGFPAAPSSSIADFIESMLEQERIPSHGHNESHFRLRNPTSAIT